MYLLSFCDSCSCKVYVNLHVCDLVLRHEYQGCHLFGSSHIMFFFIINKFEIYCNHEYFSYNLYFFLCNDVTLKVWPCPTFINQHLLDF